MGSKVFFFLQSNPVKNVLAACIKEIPELYFPFAAFSAYYAHFVNEVI